MKTSSIAIYRTNSSGKIPMLPRGRARFYGHDNDDALCMLGHMYVHACRKWCRAKGSSRPSANCRIIYAYILIPYIKQKLLPPPYIAVGQ